MARHRRQRIVVGVSGSLASVSALSWAAEEARLRGARLHVVRVWNPAWHAAPYAAVGALPAGEQLQAAARSGLAAAMRAQFGAAAPGDVTAELAEGVPERVLVDRSADADLLVIGAAAPARRDEPSAGPVVRACLAGAHCPVVVIVGGEDDPTPAGRPLADAVM